MEKEAASLKNKKILQSVNPTALNQREKNREKSCHFKKKKNPSMTKLDSLNAKAIKWKKKLQV